MRPYRDEWSRGSSWTSHAWRTTSRAGSGNTRVISTRGFIPPLPSHQDQRPGAYYTSSSTMFALARSASIKTRRKTLPEAVLGMEVTNSTSRIFL